MSWPNVTDMVTSMNIPIKYAKKRWGMMKKNWSSRSKDGEFRRIKKQLKRGQRWRS
jgi:hypothetical protein